MVSIFQKRGFSSRSVNQKPISRCSRSRARVIHVSCDEGVPALWTDPQRRVDDVRLVSLRALAAYVTQCALNPRGTILHRTRVINGSEELAAVRRRQHVEAPPGLRLGERARQVLGHVNLSSANSVAVEYVSEPLIY
jgi:hypothetical protein